MVQNMQERAELVMQIRNEERVKAKRERAALIEEIAEWSVSGEIQVQDFKGHSFYEPCVPRRQLAGAIRAKFGDKQPV